MNEDDEFLQDDYADVRCELFAKGHNLTSVLINPRESILDDIFFDEFAVEQSTPLDYNSSLNTVINYSLSIFSTHPSSSVHTSNSSHTTNSSHSISSASINGSNSTGLAPMLTLTQRELQQIQEFIKKTYQLNKIYMNAHHNKHISHNNNSLSTSQNHLNMQKLATEELKHCYREIPEIFFQEHFSLTDQDTFTQTLSIAEFTHHHRHSVSIAGNNNAIVNSSNNTILSRYLDMVEVSLLKQIYARSFAFFKTLNDLQLLQVKVHDTTNHLKAIRREVHHLDGKHCTKLLSIAKISTKQKNMHSLNEKLSVIQQILLDRQAVYALVEAEDYFTAQEIILRVREYYKQHALHKIHCISTILDKFLEIEGVINNVLCNKFVTMAIQWDDSLQSNDSDENHLLHAESVHVRAEISSDLSDLEHLAQSILSSSLSSEEVTGTARKRAAAIQCEQLSKLLTALLCAEKLHTALQMYKSRLNDAVKMIIRTCVTEYLSNFDPMMLEDNLEQQQELHDENSSQQLDTESASSSIQQLSHGHAVPFMQRIKSMSTDNFLGCLSMCFEHVLLSVQRAHVFHTSIISCFHEMDANSKQQAIDEDDIALMHAQSQSPTPAMRSRPLSLDAETREKVLKDSRQALEIACETATKSIAQLIDKRREMNGRSSPEQMKFLWEKSLHFIAQLESISSRHVFSLKQCLSLQTRCFLDYWHQNYKNKLVSTLDSERWQQCDTSRERQEIIDRLASGKTLLSGSEQFLGTGDTLGSAGKEVSAESSSTRKREKEAKAVVVERKEYKVVWSVLLLVEVLTNYLDIVLHFGAITNEVITKANELLQLFNNRTKQLVLGAQAINSAAKLKSISAKHLAYTAQSLSLLIVLLPHIRAAFLAQLTANYQQVLQAEFLRIHNELFEHHNQIVGKFVMIINDTIELSANRLRHVDWERAGQSGALGNVEYFEEMTKNITTLHRVLSNILPAEQIQEIFSRIFGMLVRKIPQHFELHFSGSSAQDSAGSVSTRAGQRILQEISQLVATLNKLKHVDTSILPALEETFRSKYK